MCDREAQNVDWLLTISEACQKYRFVSLTHVNYYSKREIFIYFVLKLRLRCLARSVRSTFFNLDLRVCAHHDYLSRDIFIAKIKRMGLYGSERIFGKKSQRF